MINVKGYNENKLYVVQMMKNRSNIEDDKDALNDDIEETMKEIENMNMKED